MSEESRIKEIRKWMDFHNTVLSILIELHKEEIKKHPAFKAFEKKWKLEEASEE